MEKQIQKGGSVRVALLCFELPGPMPIVRFILYPLYDVQEKPASKKAEGKISG